MVIRTAMQTTKEKRPMPPNTASLLSTVDTAPFPAGRPSTGMPVLRPYQVEVAQAVLDSIARG